MSRVCCLEYTFKPTENVVVMPSGSFHYSKIICGHCNRFLRWGKNPKTDDVYEQRQSTINKILNEKTDKLNQREIDFLNNISQSRFISPKQSTWFANILSKTIV